MKTGIGKSKQTTTNRRATKTVRFSFRHPTARSVFIAGTFNEWHPTVTEMIKVGDGQWAKELVLAPGDYEYLFVVESEWMPDPAAPDRAPNPFGGVNSILHVSAD